MSVGDSAASACAMAEAPCVGWGGLRGGGGAAQQAIHDTAGAEAGGPSPRAAKGSPSGKPNEPCYMSTWKIQTGRCRLGCWCCCWLAAGSSSRVGSGHGVGSGAGSGSGSAPELAEASASALAALISQIC